eukprot:6707194-Karenia_brevis.AAC.1
MAEAQWRILFMFKSSFHVGPRMTLGFGFRPMHIALDAVRPGRTAAKVWTWGFLKVSATIV